MISFLNKEDSDYRLNVITQALRSLGHENIYNPSFFINHLTHIVFRSFGSKKTTPIESFYLQIDVNKNILPPISLSEKFQSFGISYVADPKIFSLNNEVWITFNSGYQKSGFNSLYIAKVYPELGQPIECNYENRVNVEKNWAFYSFENYLYALYSLNPLTILRSIKPLSKIKQSHDLLFSKYYLNTESKNKLSIGTQLQEYKKNSYFIAHKKISFLGKRLYLGVPCKINLKDPHPELRVSSIYLAHSISSLWGSLNKHNKNLISCSYFSGLQIKDNMAYLGYGINDINFSLRKTNFKKLWPQ